MPNSTPTVDPEVVPSGTAVPMTRSFSISPQATWFAWGTLFGLGVGFAIYWYIKKKM